MNTLSRNDTLTILASIQNRSVNWDRDIMTFAGLCSDEEVKDHIIREFARLPEGDQRDVLASSRRFAA